MNTKWEGMFKIQTTKIGNLQESAEGYGCMGLSHAYGAPVEHDTAVKMIRTAFDMGCTFFDTAEGYKGTFADGSISYNEQLVGEAYEKNKALFEFLREMSAAHNCTPAQLSLAWMMNKKPYIVPIPGTKNADRLDENMKAADVVLTAEEVKLIDERLDDMTMSEYFGGSPIIKKN